MKTYLSEKKTSFSPGRKTVKSEVNGEKNLKRYLHHKGICLYNL